MQIVELTSLSWPAVRTAIDLYEAGGMAALKPKERGKKSGDGRKPHGRSGGAYSKADRRQAARAVEDGVRAVDARRGRRTDRGEFEIKLSVRAVGNYLKRWGFTPQKPIRRAYEQRPEAVKKWIDEEYPSIAAKAKAEGGEIQWGDETALVNTDVRGRSYAPRGETPVTLRRARDRNCQ